MNLIKIDIWPDSIIDYWKSKNIRLAPGVSLEIILEAENILSFKFPGSFKTLYEKVNGFRDNDWTENMISIWPINKIIGECEKNSDFIGFSDYLLNSHVYGFLKGQEGIYKNYDLKSHMLPEKIADTFEEVINQINSDSDLLY